jgi:hypothetical protein
VRKSVPKNKNMEAPRGRCSKAAARAAFYWSRQGGDAGEGGAALSAHPTRKSTVT